MTRRLWIGAVLVIFSLTSALSQQPSSPLSTPQQFEDDLRQVPCRNSERLKAVRTLFEKMNAGESDISVQKFRQAQNLAVTRKGTGQDKIVIGAHYDFVDSGCGAVDNWSGIVALAHLYRTIRQFEVSKTVLFVAFDREEDGLVGSRAMVDAIPRADLPQYCAMINMDSFGLAQPFALTHTSSTELIGLTEEIALSMQIPFYRITLPQTDADSSSFLAKKIPAITLSGLSNDWKSILHTRMDQTVVVNRASVYLGYRLALALWNRIEVASCDSLREKGPSLK